MSEKFLHGVEVLEIDAGPRPISTVRSSVIGIIGTAPDAEAQATASLATGDEAIDNALTWTASLAGALGNRITVTLNNPRANDAALSVAVSAGTNITANLATGATGTITTTAAQLMAAIAANEAAAALVTVTATGLSDGTGAVEALRQTALAGGLDDAFPLNTPVMVAGSRTHAAKLGDAGTLPAAMDSIFDQAGAVVIVVRVAEEADPAEQLAAVLGGVNATTGDYEGVHCFLGAESKVGFAPRILLAPGFTHERDSDSANAVVAELVGIAERLRAVILVDGPDTTDDEAIAAAGDFGTARAYLCDP
ncbi:MAG TPA: hypothetical protein VIR04_06165, partial [Paralcaligenes sp.]